MRSRMVNAALVAATALSLAACAGPIEKACLKAGRAAATPGRCDCIQDAADGTLGRGDQRLAASFFEDPHRAQEIRQSSRPSHSAFWDRYKSFGAAAERSCR